MAYLKLGKSQHELRELYLQKAGQLDEPEMVALFGRRPSRILELDDEERGTLTYNEMKSRLFRDQNGREYQPYGARQPRWCYVLLPRALTLKERHLWRDEMDVGALIDFPRAGDPLELRVIGARDEARAPRIECAVVSVLMTRQATGLLELSIDVPTVEQVPDSRVGRRSEAKAVHAERRRLGLEGTGDEERRQEVTRERGYFLDRREPEARDPGAGRGRPSKRRLVERAPRAPSAYKKW